jgi:hypothetical protein
MDKREAFFKTLQALVASARRREAVLPAASEPLFPLGEALLTLPDTPRKKRLGVWFHAFRIAF